MYEDEQSFLLSFIEPPAAFVFLHRADNEGIGIGEGTLSGSESFVDAIDPKQCLLWEWMIQSGAYASFQAANMRR